MAHDTPGGADAIRAMLPDEAARALGPLEPGEPQTLWWGELTYLQPGLPPAQTRYLTFALVEPDGERIGWAIFYLPAAPASIVSLITRGNQGMFARMAELLQPARHETAILFADIQASSSLARHLSSQRWFELIRDFLTEADQAAIRRTGIVGQHAGDGMTAFFLAEHAGSRAAACAAALEAGREIVNWRPPGMERGELRINAGVHWGGALYLGQVITGGRLEVTALGDEVNECARIQQSARDGALLASKPLVERLDPEHARGVRARPADDHVPHGRRAPGRDAEGGARRGRDPGRDGPASAREVEREVVELADAVAREQPDVRRAAGIDALAIGHVAERRGVDRVDQRHRLTGRAGAAAEPQQRRLAAVAALVRGQAVLLDHAHVAVRRAAAAGPSRRCRRAARSPCRRSRTRGTAGPRRRAWAAAW